MNQPPVTLAILLPLPLTEVYDYLPENNSAPKGAIVEVPIGKKVSVGVVWGPGKGGVAETKLKPILRVLDLPPLPKASRAFIDWAAQYTVTPPGSVLKMAFGSPRLLHLKKNDAIPTQALNPDHHVPELTPEQKKAADALVERVSPAFSVTLLDGVTGSGKTEVYCEAIAECLRQGKQALVLLPEIAMTAALMDRLTARFGIEPVQWHSELSEKQRRLNWHAIAHGKAKFILGARSALFLPYPDLGLIVVDEEHEAAYKQEEGVIYHGRDMAVARGHIGGIPVILSSATPSLETLFNVQQGKYGHVTLRHRYGKASLPKIDLVDLRQFKLPAQNFISPPLLDALTQTIADKHQAMLFLNRRGYAPLTLCRACGNRLNCPNCTSWLTEHKQTGRLQCHHCNYTMRLPDKCPKCGAEDRFAACGPGVERIAEEVKRVLPDARFAIMASDTLPGPKAAQEMVDQMANRELDLLIGTQIMAKGYHFPRLTLVGVVDADLGLAGGDPRAAERTFQLLQQVAGRSGRGDDPGGVILQTTAPDHPVMKALVKGDRDAFMAAEMHERAAYNLPPVSRLASVTVSGANVKQVIDLANELAAVAPQTEKIRILGPAPAPFAMLRGRYRHRLLLQASRNVNVSQVLRQWVGAVKAPRNMRILIDVDPYSFL